VPTRETFNHAEADAEKPTLRPTFDVIAFARSQERNGPPSSTSSPAVAPMVNVSLDDPSGDMLKLPETVFFSRLDDRVRRTELLLMMIRSGGISRSIGARALRAQLEALRRGAIDLGVLDLVALLEVIGAVVGELTDTSRDDTCHAREVLVLDEDEVQRDLITLAVEAEGHSVRCARDFDELVELIGERVPDVLVTEAELTNVPTRYLASALRDLVSAVPIVAFTTKSDAATTASLHHISARMVSKEAGIEALVAELSSLWMKRNGGA
jgi:CheY-like chemotaxis protein